MPININHISDTNNVLSNIVDYLIFKSNTLSEIGLFHGKMGLVVTLYLYAKKYNDDIVNEYAWDLLQQVYDGIHTNVPIDLENGLAGIGYGTTLLCQYGIFDCNLNDILLDIDTQIMERDPRRFTDFSMRTGVKGLMLYIKKRQEVEPIRTFDSQYITDLQTVIVHNGIACEDRNIMDLISEPQFQNTEYVEKPIELDGGSSFFIFKSILK